MSNNKNKKEVKDYLSSISREDLEKLALIMYTELHESERLNYNNEVNPEDEYSSRGIYDTNDGENLI